MYHLSQKTRLEIKANLLRPSVTCQNLLCPERQQKTILKRSHLPNVLSRTTGVSRSRLLRELDARAEKLRLLRKLDARAGKIHPPNG